MISKSSKNSSAQPALLQERFHKKKHRYKEFFITAAVLGGWFLLTSNLGLSVCVIRAIFGVPCPGCGMTTAALALLDGDISAAYRTNAVIFLLPPVAVCLCLDIFLRKYRVFNYTRWFYLFAAVLSLTYFAVRMYLSFPDGDYPMNIAEDTIITRLFSTGRAPFDV